MHKLKPVLKPVASVEDGGLATAEHAVHSDMADTEVPAVVAVEDATLAVDATSAEVLDVAGAEEAMEVGEAMAVAMVATEAMAVAVVAAALVGAVDAALQNTKTLVAIATKTNASDPRLDKASNPAPTSKTVTSATNAQKLSLLQKHAALRKTTPVSEEMYVKTLTRSESTQGKTYAMSTNAAAETLLSMPDTEDVVECLIINKHLFFIQNKHVLFLFIHLFIGNLID